MSRYIILADEVVECRLCHLMLMENSKAVSPDKGKTVFCVSCVEVILLGWLDSEDVK